MEPKDVKKGQHVVYIDPVGNERAAIVTAVWPSYNAQFPGLNVVYVDAEKGDDSYGAQISRDTSVAHESWKVAHGRYWKLPSQ